MAEVEEDCPPTWPGYVLALTFALLFALMMTVMIIWATRRNKAGKRIRDAASNNRYCTQSPADCTIVQPATIDLPPWSIEYSAATASDFLLMIDNVYQGKLPTHYSKSLQWEPLGDLGYIVTTNDVTYIVLRGTDVDQEEEVRANLRMAQVPYDGLLCHRGYVEITNDLLPTIDAALGPDPTNVFITGHSLGAAVGMLVAQRLALTHDVVVYNFGSPRVCNCADIAGFTLFNIQNMLDPVTSYPPSVTPDKNDLYFYCEHGVAMRFQDNRLSLSQNHALTTYFGNVPVDGV